MPDSRARSSERSTQDERQMCRMERRLWHAANRPPQQGPGTVEEPFSVPPPCGKRAWPQDVDWCAWFRNLVQQTRALRELLGLSQDRLGTLAGVSQASVSRFERGTAQGTPAIVMLKVAVALARQCRADDHTRLAEPLVRILDDIEELVPVRAVGELPMIARDPQAEQLQILFRAVPPRAREAVLSIVRAFCTIAGGHPRTDPV